MASINKERPILFSAPMVKAILDGRKTQTRRVMKFQPPSSDYQLSRLMDTTDRKLRKHIGKLHWVKMDGHNVADETQDYFLNPYGEIGDRLWVKETFARHPQFADIAYRAEGEEFEDSDGFLWVPKWTPSIYMPRVLSRILFEITNIRVERLQDISEADAIAEGIEKAIDSNAFIDYRLEHKCPTIRTTSSDINLYTAIDSYKSLWESINGKGSWDLNPWVWVIEFKRI